MTWTQRGALSLVWLNLMTACAGGGGGGEEPLTGGDAKSGEDGGVLVEDGGIRPEDGGTGPSAPPAVTFSPDRLKETYGSGDTLEATVKATLHIPSSDKAYLVILDTGGAFNPKIWVKPAAGEPSSYDATAETASSLAVGRYQGAFEVRVCRDEACGEQYPGSPCYLPYDVQVIPGTNLTPLTRWPSVSDWETFQGNAAHTGYVPVTLDPSKFSPRWRWTPPTREYGLSMPVISNGWVYVSNTPYNFFTDPPLPRTLVALRESDKELQWKVDFGTTVELNPPAVSTGRVFVAATGRSDGFMWSFDASTGEQRSKQAVSGLGRLYAPTLEGGVSYAGCGNGAAVCAFNTGDGTLKWTANLNMSSSYWTPAVDENYVYTYREGVLSAVIKSTGEAAFTLTGPKSGDELNEGVGTPVLGASGTVFAVRQGFNPDDGFLTQFNTLTRKISWSVRGRYQVNPVLANGVVYAVKVPEGSNRPTLVALRADKGGLLWTWTPPSDDNTIFWADGRDATPLLVTDNLIFVSTARHVYAVDLTTRRLVWSYWDGGHLALSASGVLYISNNSEIGAVNVK